MATDSKLAKFCGQSLMLGLAALILTSIVLAIVVLCNLIVRFI
jgi:hypothetical protein